MTVRELHEKLTALLAETPNMTVVTDLHSEFAEVETVERMTGYDNGGYISRAYRQEDQARTKGYVYIGTR